METPKTNLELLKEKRDRLKSKLETPDPLMQAFVGGRVGFKKGTAAKKWATAIDKELDLMRELKEIEEKIYRIENPLTNKKATLQDPNEWSKGDKGYDSFNNIVECIKVNKNTITVQYEGGFKEAIKPHLLTKIKPR